MRFWGEHVFAILIGTESFILNQSNYPVLQMPHQYVIKEYMKSRCSVILRPQKLTENTEDHLFYLAQYLFGGHDKLDREEQIEVNYRNYIQSPLQPLADNLESATYETFENDSIKYDLYEMAMAKAFACKKRYGRFRQTRNCFGLQYKEIKENAGIDANDLVIENQSYQADVDMIPTKNSLNDPSGGPKPQDPIVVMYFGAGRGPLIKKALMAASRE